MPGLPPQKREAGVGPAGRAAALLLCSPPPYRQPQARRAAGNDGGADAPPTLTHGAGRTLRVGEVDHRAVVLEEVDLLDGGDVVHAEPLQRVLQPLVIRGCCLVDGLLLPSDRALAARPDLRGHLRQLLRIHGCQEWRAT
eukprot:scaffold18040_cov63-Phaeocystis_antarctica.AAC.3